MGKPWNAWVAVAAGTDRRVQARRLAQAHEDALTGGPPGAAVRDVIARSWERCHSAGVDPLGGVAPRPLNEEEAAGAWNRSPLAIAEAVVGKILHGVEREGQQVVLVCDAHGDLLWIDGERKVVEQAREIGLEPGARWAESAAGTNAMGTALALDHPIQVFSAEHFAAPLHRWTCSAAPIHDPETKTAIGVIDLSGDLKTAHPHSLALVEMAARMIEATLAAERSREHRKLIERFGGQVRRESGHPIGLASAQGTVLQSLDLPASWLDLPRNGGLIEVGGSLLLVETLEGGGFLLWPAGDPAQADPRGETLRLEVLGGERATVRIGSRSFQLSRRQTEVLVLLCLRREGVTADQLAVELHGDFGVAVTARAEITRLRRALGIRLASRPYRLEQPVESDFEELDALVRSGRVAEALGRYPGPMLPYSEVPTIVEARESLDHALREAALRAADADLLHAWVTGPAGREDLDACRRLATLLDGGDPRRAAVLSRLRRLSGS